MQDTTEPVDGGSSFERSGPPWEDPQAGDLIQRLWQTIVKGVSRPGELFEGMRLTGGMVQPLLFYLAIVGPAILVGVFLEQPIQLMMGMTLGEQMIRMIFVLVLLPFLLPLGLFINSGLTQLGLMVFGGANQPFEATFRVNAYAYGSVGWIWALPFCGTFVGSIWGIVLVIMGVARVHEISTGKAVAAVLVPVFVVFLLFACLGFFAGAALA